MHSVVFISRLCRLCRFDVVMDNNKEVCHAIMMITDNYHSKKR